MFISEHGEQTSLQLRARPVSTGQMVACRKLVMVDGAVCVSIFGMCFHLWHVCDVLFSALFGALFGSLYDVVHYVVHYLVHNWFIFGS